MKIAAYNVENLFDRAKAFNEETTEAQRVVKQEAELNALLQKPEYTAANKKKILELMEALGIKKADDGWPVFSRDCPEYCVETPQGEQIWILPNHFKSKFGGDTPSAKAKRTLQAEKTVAIYERLVSEGNKNIIVLGDLNDTPNSEPLKSLIKGTDLKDISDHPVFDTGEFAGRGTFGLGNDNNKIDYLLLSPALFDRITACGLFRKGAWPGKSPKRWKVYDELKEELHVASDHHVVWCEIA